MTSDQEVSRYRATSKLASDVGGTHDYNYEGKVLVRRCRISRDVAGVRSKIRAAYPGAAPGTRKRKTAARR